MQPLHNGQNPVQQEKRDCPSDRLQIQDPDNDEEQEVDLGLGVSRRRHQDLYADTA